MSAYSIQLRGRLDPSPSAEETFESVVLRAENADLSVAGSLNAQDGSFSLWVWPTRGPATWSRYNVDALVADMRQTPGVRQIDVLPTI